MRRSLLALATICALLVATPALGTGQAGKTRNGRIFFVSYIQTNYDLYSMTAEGGRLRRLTANDRSDWDPEVSPDGAAIVFTRAPHSFSGPVPGAVFVMGTDGRGLRRLTSGSFYTSPAWSPDGARIAFDRYEPGADVSVYVMNADGTDKRLFLRDAEEPAWSRDGKRLAFIVTTQGGGDRCGFDSKAVLTVASSSGTHRRNVVTTQKLGVLIGAYVGCLSEPHWSPDGVRLTFSAHYAEVYEPRVEYNGTFIVHADGTHLRRLASSIDASDASTAWAPDGTRIAVGLQHIYTMDPHGGHRVDLTPGASGGTEPTWQPLCSPSGTAGDDNLRGTRRGDLVCGLRGNDRISGGRGKDRLFGGPGDDRIDARDGDYDVIGCGAGRDAVVGDRGDLVGRDCERVMRR